MLVGCSAAAARIRGEGTVRPKNLIVFVIAVAISLVAAGHRWGDSGHAIGLVQARGGEARHPIVLEGGKELYSLIVTATVIPPYRGNARLVLEGIPEADYEIHFSEPIIDLRLRRRPEFRDNVLYGLQPRDRLALWVVLRPSTPAKGRHTLGFYDTKTDRLVLSVPVVFRGEGEGDAEGHR